MEEKTQLKANTHFKFLNQPNQVQIQPKLFKFQTQKCLTF